MKPTLGRIVLFTSANGDGVQSPAVVIGTKDSRIPVENLKAGPHEPGTLADDFVFDLPTSNHVDLLVHGLAKDYRVYCVEMDDNHDTHLEPRTWRWPPRD